MVKQFYLLCKYWNKIRTGHRLNRNPDSTVAYGCELRSIASANVYGNKGVQADGLVI